MRTRLVTALVLATVLATTLISAVPVKAADPQMWAGWYWEAQTQ